MKVSQLIKELQKQDGDLEVVMFGTLEQIDKKVEAERELTGIDPVFRSTVETVTKEDVPRMGEVVLIDWRM